MQNYTMFMNFGNFIGSRIISLDANDDGRRIDGIFIPFKYNGIKPYKNKVYGRFYITEIEINEKGYTHNIRPCLPKEDAEELVHELGYKIPFLGHVRPSFVKFDKKGEKHPQYVRRKH